MSRPLTSLAPGEEAQISKIHAAEALYHRLTALGFRSGRPIRLLRRAAFRGPLHIRIGSTDVIIRASDARCIELVAI
ncbi:MAG: ferrous iron transport protein A [Rhodocyclaceae bacterium]|jgi:ferrous iron transport protein A|nr:ferrous iron transport protein A [Rhodocyclaceae bacterium]